MLRRRGRKNELGRPGVDVENIQAIPDDRLALILTEPERAACHDRTIDPLTVFCAKEAFYKCYFPLFGSFLTFQDVYVVIQQRTPNVGRFARRC
ncbi:MAG: 4'-phosphopantetheinyl transferase superfamily protein [Alphaproteobacteria bacterium]